MIKENTKIYNLSLLEEQIKIINSVRQSSNLNEFLKKKFLETLNQVMDERLTEENTNTAFVPVYRNNNHFEDTEDGFIMYNDTVLYGEKYTFSIALAFEYGTGIIGQENPVVGHWQYNVNNKTVRYNDDENYAGWWLSVDKAGKSQTFGESRSGKAIITRGYQGMEIYRFTAERIKENLSNWLKEYVEKEV